MNTEEAATVLPTSISFSTKTGGIINKSLDWDGTFTVSFEPAETTVVELTWTLEYCDDQGGFGDHTYDAFSPSSPLFLTGSGTSYQVNVVDGNLIDALCSGTSSVSSSNSDMSYPSGAPGGDMPCGVFVFTATTINAKTASLSIDFYNM